MRRWNGWGDEADDAPLGAAARAFLVEHLGEGAPPADARLEDVVAAVGPSRLPVDPLLSADPELRVRRARGQSFPDLIATRSGRLDAVPDAVARPASGTDVRRVIDLARAAGARVVPWGGGTSVVGGVTVRPSPDPVVTVDLAGLAGVRSMDERSGLVTVGSGTTGPALASFLSPIGLAVGHEPQSWELATVGGWVAARGSGLRSIGVGRIEQLFAGRDAGGARRDARHAAVPSVRRRTGPPPARARLGGSPRDPDRRRPAGDARARRRTTSTRSPSATGDRRSRPRVRSPGPERPLGPAPVDACRDADAARVRGPAAGHGAVESWLRVRRVPGDWSLLLVGTSGLEARRQCGSP